MGQWNELLPGWRPQSLMRQDSSATLLASWINNQTRLQLHQGIPPHRSRTDKPALNFLHMLH